MADYMSLTAARRKLQAAYHDFWYANDLDAIMLPGAPQTATRFDEWGPITCTVLWNFLDYPATIIPTGRVRATDVADGEDSVLYGEQDLKHYKLCECLRAVLMTTSANHLLQTILPRHTWTHRYLYRLLR